MKIALLQINPTVGDLLGKSELIANGVREAGRLGADLVVTPELALLGYLPRDLLLKTSFIDDSWAVLEQLAEATGGRVFFPFKMKDITRSFAAIEDELRSQYVVSYKPANFDADGRYRSIEISSLKKDLQVRARKGYFAPQQ